jgi:beta-lactamase class A
MGGLDATTWWERDADEPVYAASLIKVPLATAAERRHRRGEIDLDAEVPVHADFDSQVAGERFALEQLDDQDDRTWAQVGGQETLRELRRRAVVDSSNIATNLLLERVGVPEVAAVLADAGCSARTTITRGIGDVAAREAGLTNEVTARDLGLVLTHTPAAIEAVMREQTHRDAIPAGLPAGTTVANKTGWVDGITHDMAIVRPEDGEPFALVVLTRTDLSNEAGDELIADLAAEAWGRRR